MSAEKTVHDEFVELRKELQRFKDVITDELAAKLGVRSGAGDDEAGDQGEARSEDGSADGVEEEAASEPDSDDGPAVRAAHSATRQLEALTGRRSEGVAALEPTDDGWQVLVELTDAHHEAAATAVVGVYEVQLSDDGELQRYRQLRRYVRTRMDGRAGSADHADEEMS